MNKRGISPLIATVLLIGFAVAMAAFVSTYIINQTKQIDVEQMIGSDELCSEVSLQVISDDNLCEEVDVPDGTVTSCSTRIMKMPHAAFKNKGAFTIWEFVVNPEQLTSYNFSISNDVGLPPSSSGGVNLPFCENHKIHIVPVIKEDGALVQCPTRSVTIDPMEMGMCG